MKVYTRKGDDGTTGVIGGTRLPKNHHRIECYGTIDELNSHVGLLHSMLSAQATPKVADRLQVIQNELFEVGSIVAADPEKCRMELPCPGMAEVQSMEAWIDQMEESLPELKNFILPGGTPSAAQAHVCRCVCRRAERLIQDLTLLNGLEEVCKAYLNRLSDLFFVLSRFLVKIDGGEEVLWNPSNR